MLAIRARAERFVSKRRDCKGDSCPFFAAVLTFDALALHRLRFPFGSNLISLPPCRLLEEMPFLIVAGARFIAANPLVAGRLPTQSWVIRMLFL